MNMPVINERYRLVNLSAAAHCLPTIAAWQHEQWLHSQQPKQTDLFAPPAAVAPDALSERQAQLRQHLGANLIPTTFVLLEKNQAVGSASLVNYRTKEGKQEDKQKDKQENKQGDKVWLTNMYVLPDYRKQGLAKILLKRAEDYARSLQLKQIFLYSMDAENYYKKLGWLTLKTVKVQGQKLKVLVRHL
jgi:GNAT superfamily N-acetyltransferase